MFRKISLFFAFILMAFTFQKNPSLPLATAHKKEQFEKFGTHIFRLNNEGVYLRNNLGGQWQRIYKTTPAKGSPESILATKDHLLLGTSKGLLKSDWEAFSFNALTSFPNHKAPIKIKTYSPNVIYALTTSDLWKTIDGGERFEKIFHSLSKELLPTNTTETSNLISESEGLLTALEVNSEGGVWIGSKRGIYQSLNGGIHFKKLTTVGLLSPNIKALVYSPIGIIAGTSKGIFYYEEAWKEIQGEWSNDSILDLSLHQNKLWISTKENIHTFDLGSLELRPAPASNTSLHSLDKIQKLLISEPNIREVQKAVIKYSNTRNGKIRLWQTSSRLRALLPDVSTSWGTGQGNNVDLDRGGTNDPDQYIAGPNDWDKDFDIDFTWDLGDILFSPSQTSIDVREKLMVELRDELVSEVTRLYFERRRLQLELLVQRPVGGKALNQWIRLDELTAQIDGMTGGMFTKKIKHKFTFVDQVLNQGARGQG